MYHLVVIKLKDTVSFNHRSSNPWPDNLINFCLLWRYVALFLSEERSWKKTNCVTKLIQLSLCKLSRHVEKRRYSSSYSQPWQLMALSGQFNALATLHHGSHWTAHWSGCFQEWINPLHLYNKVHTKQNTAWITIHTAWLLEETHIQYTFWNFSLLVCVAVCSTTWEWTTRSLSK